MASVINDKLSMDFPNENVIELTFLSDDEVYYKFYCSTKGFISVFKGAESLEYVWVCDKDKEEHLRQLIREFFYDLNEESLERLRRRNLLKIFYVALKEQESA